MNITQQFLIWVFEQGLDISLSHGRYASAYHFDGIPIIKIRLKYQNRQSEFSVENWDRLEEMLCAGYAEKICRDLMVPEFKIKEGGRCD